MTGTTPVLTAREKDVLRLILLGHDAKSVARELALSSHTVNEYLRSARVKLGASSSREAARRFGAPTGDASNFLVPEEIGDARIAETSQLASPQTRNGSLTMMLGASLGTTAAIGLGFMLAGTGTAPTAATAPKVVQTTPARGAVIPPGSFVLKVTFDRPMKRGSMSFATDDRPAFPDCPGKPSQSADGRSFSMNCIAKPGHSHIIWFNHGRFRNFKSADEGIPAEPTRLIFSVRAR